jgi:uncharacterized protein YbjQ (UPF0145 family)
MSELQCPKCGHVNPAATGDPLDACPACGLIYARYDDAAALRDRVNRARSSGDWSGIPRQHIPDALVAEVAARLPVTTTPTLPGRMIAQAVDVVSAECAYGMNVLKDFFAGVTDVVGGRSGSTQRVLRDARRQVMAELRAEAFALDADAVVGVRLDFNEFSGGGKSMLFVVATGTAVKLAPLGKG